MKTFLKTVNFGISKAGLSTVGYTLYDSTGNVYAPRSTSGVFAVGSTGIYGAKIDFPDSTEIILLWDTGGSSPRYALDMSTIQLNNIQEETDNIRIIWNTLKNTGELYLKLLEKIDNIKIPTDKDVKKAIKGIKDDIKDIKIPGIEEIKNALTVNVENNIEEISALRNSVDKMNSTMKSNYRGLIKILTAISGIAKKADSINLLLKNHIKSEGDIKNVKNAFAAMIKEFDRLFGGLQSDINEFRSEFANAIEYLDKSIEENTKIDKTVKDMLKVRVIGDLLTKNTGNTKNDTIKLGLGVK